MDSLVLIFMSSSNSLAGIWTSYATQKFAYVSLDVGQNQGSGPCSDIGVVTVYIGTTSWGNQPFILWIDRLTGQGSDGPFLARMAGNRSQ